MNIQQPNFELHEKVWFIRKLDKNYIFPGNIYRIIITIEEDNSTVIKYSIWCSNPKDSEFIGFRSKDSEEKDVFRTEWEAQAEIVKRNS